METLVEVISACVEVHSPMGPLGSRDLALGAPCALLVSLTPVELVRGAEDGAVVFPGCSLDLHGLLAHCDRVEACRWAPYGLGSYNPDGPRGAIEGLSQGHDVWRRVAAAACGGRAGPATLCWRTPLKATPPQREASRGRCEPPRLCMCKRRGRSVGGLRVRGWSRRRARWPGWQGEG
jgi:hypothetical protein